MLLPDGIRDLAGRTINSLQNAAARWHQGPSWPYNSFFEKSRYLKHFSLCIIDRKKCQILPPFSKFPPFFNIPTQIIYNRVPIIYNPDFYYIIWPWLYIIGVWFYIIRPRLFKSADCKKCLIRPPFFIIPPFCNYSDPDYIKWSLDFI